VLDLWRQRGDLVAAGYALVLADHDRIEATGLLGDGGSNATAWGRLAQVRRRTD
jgi:hypothetical protein